MSIQFYITAVPKQNNVSAFNTLLNTTISAAQSTLSAAGWTDANTINVNFLEIGENVYPIVIYKKP